MPSKTFFDAMMALVSCSLSGCSRNWTEKAIFLFSNSMERQESSEKNFLFCSRMRFILFSLALLMSFAFMLTSLAILASMLVLGEKLDGSFLLIQNSKPPGNSISEKFSVNAFNSFFCSFPRFFCPASKNIQRKVNKNTTSIVPVTTLEIMLMSSVKNITSMDEEKITVVISTILALERPFLKFMLSSIIISYAEFL